MSGGRGVSVAPVNTEATSPDINSAMPAVNTRVVGVGVVVVRVFSGSEKWPVSCEFGRFVGVLSSALLFALVFLVLPIVFALC